MLISKVALSFLMFNYIFVAIAFIIEKNWGSFWYWFGVIVSVGAMYVYGIKHL
jgi:hypothetical protein